MRARTTRSPPCLHRGCCANLRDNERLQYPVSAVPTADDLICAALRGENPAWPWGGDPAAIMEFQRRAEVHGASALLHTCLAAGADDWPPHLLQELRATAVQLAMWELRHQQILAETLAALNASGVEPVLIKGTALAYSLYPDPALRTRGDTDLLVPEDAKDRAHEVLGSLGFERSLAVSGEFVSYQANYSRVAPEGGAHTLDLHWKINNSELLSRLFTYDELRRDAQPLPQLCPHALGASPVYALLLASMHRCTHKQNPYYVDGVAHYDADRLIWLYDTHLLAGQLVEREWEEFLRQAQQKELRAVCLEGFERASACLQTEVPPAVITSLQRRGRHERPARYLGSGKLRQQWMDFRSLDSLRDQLRLVREIFFPPASYMRDKYSQARVAALPWLYWRRVVGGFLKSFRRADRAR
jgi:putative nucleotidyltransferase-like protein